MTAPVNPFRPGFGSRPPVLAGREDLLDDVEDAIAMTAEAGVASSAFLIIGPRGVGKSVVLDEITDRAQDRYGWLALHVQKIPGSTLNELLLPRLKLASRHLENFDTKRPKASRLRLEELEVGAGGGISMVRADAKATFRRAGGPEDQNLAEAVTASLHELARLALLRETGVLLTLDETQDVTKEEFGALGAFAQDITRQNLPFLVAAAGLPTIDNDRLPTYFVRGERHDLGMLDRAAARRALEEPAAAAKRPFTPDALERVLGATGGYPFAIQLYGREVWRASAGRREIAADEALEAGLARAGSRLDRTVHRDHWVKAAPAEKRYLRAVAELSEAGGPFTGGDVAQQLGQAPASVAALRARLIDAGALTFDGAQLAFATPGMARYVLDQELPPVTGSRRRGRALGPGGALDEPRPARSTPRSPEDRGR